TRRHSCCFGRNCADATLPGAECYERSANGRVAEIEHAVRTEQVMHRQKAESVSGTRTAFCKKERTAQETSTNPDWKSQVRAVYCAICIAFRPWLFPFRSGDAGPIFCHLIRVPNLLLLRWLEVSPDFSR